MPMFRSRKYDELSHEILEGRISYEQLMNKIKYGRRRGRISNVEINWNAKVRKENKKNLTNPSVRKIRRIHNGTRVGNIRTRNDSFNFLRRYLWKKRF
jgi:hypothetical protein